MATIGGRILALLLVSIYVWADYYQPRENLKSRCRGLLHCVEFSPTSHWTGKRQRGGYVQITFGRRKIYYKRQRVYKLGCDRAVNSIVSASKELSFRAKPIGGSR
jgi:hypothetical protein